MDGLSLHAVIAELQPLVNGKIDKVQQPERDALVLTVRTEQRENIRLLLSANAETGRVQVTEKSYGNPPEPPVFCMLLRRRMQGARIMEISQRGLDRVMTITMMARNDLGDQTTLRLVVELMGKYSNIIVVQQDGMILDCIRHVGPGMSQVRLLLPGRPFEEAPGQEKRNPLSMQLEDAAAIVNSTELSPDKYLSAQYEGISRSVAKELTAGNGFTAQRLTDAFTAFYENRFQPCVIVDLFGEPLSILPFHPNTENAAFEAYPSMSAAYEAYYARRDTTQMIQRHGFRLKKVLENALSRVSKKLELYHDAISSTERLEQLKLYGELITANMYCIKKGQSHLLAQNYYLDPPEEIIIPLDPLLSPSTNAQKYYRQYRKGCTARDYAIRELGGAEKEISYLQGQLDNISKCETLPELMEIRDELLREAYLKPEKKGIRQRFAKSSPMHFVTEDGFSILVGKNNRQNDDITMSASGDQYWFHVKNAPGSHVLIQFNGTPSEMAMLAAAHLAVYYSSQKNGANVAVDYTQRKNVKKPSGAKGGMVIYTTNKTMYITPDPVLIKQLKREDIQK